MKSAQNKSLLIDRCRLYASLFSLFVALPGFWKSRIGLRFHPLAVSRNCHGANLLTTILATKRL
jgi:hypothetical protein